MNTKQQCLLISADTVKVISSAEMLKLLDTTSSISRGIGHWDRNKPRETMASFSGINTYTGILVHVKMAPLYDGRWLMILTFTDDSDAGTPSAATPPLSPTPPTLRASGMYKFSGASAYKEHTHNLYMSKREQGKPRSSCPAGGSL